MTPDERYDTYQNLISDELKAVELTLKMLRGRFDKMNGTGWKTDATEQTHRNTFIRLLVDAESVADGMSDELSEAAEAALYAEGNEE